LSNGGEALGLFPTLHVALQLMVSGGELHGGLFEEAGLAMFAVGKETKEGTNEEKIERLTGLIGGEAGKRGGVAERGENSGEQPASPAEPEGGDHTREEKEILKELAPKGWSVASDMDGDGDRGQASGDSERSGNVLLIHVVPN
jgi:hypothetical protein